MCNGRAARWRAWSFCVTRTLCAASTIRELRSCNRAENQQSELDRSRDRSSRLVLSPSFFTFFTPKRKKLPFYYALLPLSQARDRKKPPPLFRAVFLPSLGNKTPPKIPLLFLCVCLCEWCACLQLSFITSLCLFHMPDLTAPARSIHRFSTPFLFLSILLSTS